MDALNKNLPCKCVVIDDDPLSINILCKHIENIGNLTVYKTFSDPLSGLLEISEHDDIDFLFLDIRMNISGLDVARVLRDKVRFLVFVSSHSEYAIDAFSVHGDRFLTKPVSFEKLRDVVAEILVREQKRFNLL
ncbi:LytR/AlgR family response regulator transcription factor [Pedobacter sandarakinus]|uniref:LytR/AlgR family response regulator transcription factor n=1 Tax=Pedobacter sandarakinus TaxID=353156 RepID=UPI002247DAFA|nr:response regulator [Pedobacter sandarakinus]MCX2573130.1 response regulator [Pedobacter sandarakinus]